MFIDNTGGVIAYGADQPGAYLRASGLAGPRVPVWDAAYPGNINGMGGVGLTAGDDPLSPDITALVTNMNAEALYLINLQRAQQGLAPIQATAISAQGQIATSGVVLAAGALFALYMFAKK